MIRIHIQHGPEATSFIVEGKLGWPWVEELENYWRAALSAEPGRPVRVYLVDVVFVDDRGRELLAAMHKHGVNLAAHGLIPEAIVEEIMSDA